MKFSREHLLKCCSSLSIPWRFSKRFCSSPLVTCVILCMDDLSLWLDVFRFDYVQAFTGLVAGEFSRTLLGQFPGAIVVADETSEILFLLVKKFWRCFLNKELLLTFLEIWLEIRLSCQTSGSSWFQMDGSKIRICHCTLSVSRPKPARDSDTKLFHSVHSTLFIFKDPSPKKGNFELQHFRFACVWISSLFLWWLVKYLKDVEYTN